MKIDKDKLVMAYHRYIPFVSGLCVGASIAGMIYERSMGRTGIGWLWIILFALWSYWQWCKEDQRSRTPGV